MPSLPSDFKLGFATASYQIEGAVAEDGRGPSIWDVFCHLDPTRTKGANGDVACDHYHRLEEDLDLMKRYGSDMYRFSLSWSRIIPLGGRDDPVNEAGIAFYNRVIDGCLARGITPWVTLYHWDLPQALHDRYGGWLDVEESQKDFEKYARLCYERFGDRVKHWITLNEPWIVSIFGYATGGNAPGRSSINPQATEGDTATEPWIVGKALIMSHARAVAAYNQNFRPSQKGQIGISLNGDYYEPWDSNDPRDSEAAERRMQFHIGWFANPIFLGQDYPQCMRDQLKDRLPNFSSDDMSLLRSAESDFYGMNYYTSQFARHKSSPAPSTDYIGNLDELQSNKAGEPVGLESGLHWLRSCPDMFRKHLTRVYRLYGKPIIITENGCPCPGEDRMTREESVQDDYRIQYFEDHLDAIGKAVSEDGAVVDGYFAWSLMDNLEWSDGIPSYGERRLGWRNEIRAVRSEQWRSSVSLTGIGVLIRPAIFAPFDASVSYMDQQRDLMAARLGYTSCSKSWAFAFHDACWTILLVQITALMGRPQEPQRVAEHLFNLILCLPWDHDRPRSSTHDFGGALQFWTRWPMAAPVLPGSPGHEPWAFLFADPCAFSITPSAIPFLDATNSPPVLVKAYGDCFSRIPLEINHLLFSLLESSDLSSFRLSCRTAACLAKPNHLPESFWASRFAVDKEMGFFSLSIGYDGTLPPISNTDWRALYFNIKHSLRNRTDTGGVRNRRRIWHSICHLTRYLVPMLNQDLDF
ncbi:hypothetical protein FDECE_9310 [Fusarium decemcellulare]|nr:hypothetical protein FDECE_9310 [Fusarium decemcellulare]